MLNSELSVEPMVMMLGAVDIPLERRVRLAKEQIAVREEVIGHLKAWLEINDKEHKS